LIYSNDFLIEKYGTEHIAAYVRICSKPCVAKYLLCGLMPNYDISHRALWLAEESTRLWEGLGFGIWVLTQVASGEQVGCFGFIRGETADQMHAFYIFDPSVWGRGYATACLQSALAFKSAKKNMSEVIAFVHYENIVSCKILKRNDFLFSGMVRHDRLISLVYRHNTSNDTTNV
jgi:RimJ/RimL family protein N-acetyltransferase